MRADSAVHPASFRDPSGFLFEREGQLFRQVNHSYAEHFRRLQDSGLYAALVEAQLLLPFESSDARPAVAERAHAVIQPEPLEFVSYPYEWCFSQLKDAALATLRAQQLALDYGMTLKDASAYNVQFHRGRPLLIDSLSFEIATIGEPWIAYRQFCQHFLAPLALMAYADARLAQLLRVYLDGIPLDMASRLLPRRTWLQPSLLIHLHLHALAQRRYAGRPTRTERSRRSVSRQALYGLAASLDGAVRRLRWRPGKTAWADYGETHGYSEADIRRKHELVAGFVSEVRPKSVWDLGANVGQFSRIASQAGILAIAFDLDPAAVEQNYRRMVQDGEERLLPLVLDLTNPSPASGWAHRERMSLAGRGEAGAVLALALIHHLAITNNLPLPRVAEFLAELAPWALVEFVPKHDSQVQRLLASRKDIFADYSQDGFEAAFDEHFELRKSEPVGDSGRTLFWWERRT